MNNKGQITVFLSLLMVTMLLLGLSVVEIVRVNMGKAKAAEAAAGAVCDVKAAYHRELFEEYHLLAVDKCLGGQGEGKTEQLAQDYLEYTLGGDDGMTVEQVVLSDDTSLIEDDCEGMKEQITSYMELYVELQGVDKLLSLMDAETAAGETSADAIEQGRNEEAGDTDLWVGEDPRSVLKRVLSGGALSVVISDGGYPSSAAFDTEALPSNGSGQSDGGWRNIDFEDIDELEEQLEGVQDSPAEELTDNLYGIGYALEFFNCYTDDDRDRPLDCEVEYMVCGRDNDHDNLEGVVNRIIVHRLPVNLAYLMTDSTKVAEAEAIAAVLALIPGVTYSAAKYLLLGCWAYAETLADIRVLLAGNSVQLIKSAGSWHTDISNIGALANVQNDGYEGADAIDYKGFLAILLAENSGHMYIRMADLIQMKLSLTEESFAMENMMCCFSMDIVIRQPGKYAAFIEAESDSVKINDALYSHEFSMSVSY